LIENPSAYLRLAQSVIPETEFLTALSRRTGCGLLLDVNNVFVSACNLGFDPMAYLDAIAADEVGEIHLAGHRVHAIGGEAILIDDHGDHVAAAVWDLYRHAIRRLGLRPTLIEWDTRVPELPVLLDEARKAQVALDDAQPPASSPVELSRC
jgi:uncharacterized protein (UPF0276 family)